MKIWRMDPDGGNQTQMTRRGVRGLVPAPVADGKQVVFLWTIARSRVTRRTKTSCSPDAD